MDNQHRKIKGYRELEQAEIDLMNRIKDQGEVMGALVSELRGLRGQQRIETRTAYELGDTPKVTHDQLSESKDAIRTAEEHLKTGVMWLVRAVALPSTF